MKTQLSLLAICLCGFGIANAQTTTTTYQTTSASTNPTYTSPVTTDSSNSPSAASTSNSISSDATLNTNSTYSTNAAVSPGVSTTTEYTSINPAKTQKDYKNFVFGVYVGLNTTKFKGENLNANRTSDGKLAGRLGYQAGFFVRGGGRLFGQIGAEYFASSSGYFVAGQTPAGDVRGNIDLKYIQVPVYIGYKLTESDRGISAVRVQLGLEYANQIGSSASDFGNVNNLQFKSGTFNALGQLGFDAGPVFLDLTYHYGLSNAITQATSSFATSQRRILSASVGFKF